MSFLYAYNKYASFKTLKRQKPPAPTFKVIFETVADKYASHVDEVPELLVGRLERRQVLLAEVGVQVAGLDARELGDVVHHLLLGRDVVVNEGAALVGAGAADTGDPGH